VDLLLAHELLTAHVSTKNQATQPREFREMVTRIMVLQKPQLGSPNLSFNLIKSWPMDRKERLSSPKQSHLEQRIKPRKLVSENWKTTRIILRKSLYVIMEFRPCLKTTLLRTMDWYCPRPILSSYSLKSQSEGENLIILSCICSFFSFKFHVVVNRLAVW